MVSACGVRSHAAASSCRNWRGWQCMCWLPSQEWHTQLSNNCDGSIPLRYTDILIVPMSTASNIAADIGRYSAQIAQPDIISGLECQLDLSPRKKKTVPLLARLTQTLKQSRVPCIFRLAKNLPLTVLQATVIRSSQGLRFKLTKPKNKKSKSW